MRSALFPSPFSQGDEGEPSRPTMTQSWDSELGFEPPWACAAARIRGRLRGWPGNPARRDQGLHGPLLRRLLLFWCLACAAELGKAGEVSDGPLAWPGLGGGRPAVPSWLCFLPDLEPPPGRGGEPVSWAPSPAERVVLPQKGPVEPGPWAPPGPVLERLPEGKQPPLLLGQRPGSGSSRRVRGHGRC